MEVKTKEGEYVTSQLVLCRICFALRNVMGAYLARKQMSFLQACLSSGFTIAGN